MTASPRLAPSRPATTHPRHSTPHIPYTYLTYLTYLLHLSTSLPDTPLPSTSACDTSRRPRHLTPRHAPPRPTLPRPPLSLYLTYYFTTFIRADERALSARGRTVRLPAPTPTPTPALTRARPTTAERTNAEKTYIFRKPRLSLLLACSLFPPISLSLSVPPCRRPEIPAVCSIRRRMYSARRACYSRMFLITFRARHASLLPWVFLLLLISSHFNYCTFFLR